MTQAAQSQVAGSRGERRRGGVPAWSRVLSVSGWVLIGAGVIVLLYVVYSLFYTNLATDSAQAGLLEEWEAQVGNVAPPDPDVLGGVSEAIPTPSPAAPGPDATSTASAAPAASPSASPRDAGQPTVEDGAAPDLSGEAVALVRFVRPGSDAVPVHAEPLVVIGGVGIEDLKRGPGHYPGTALPGEDGNFAVAGHRTTYGAPFLHLDELQAGDEIHVTDRDGTVWVYRYVEERIVYPGDVSVIGHDPLRTGEPTLTLTTCHPRFSARQRLIVFAELVT